MPLCHGSLWRVHTGLYGAGDGRRSGNMSAYLWLQQHDLYAADFCLIKDVNNGGVVTPLNAEDGAKTALMEALKKLKMVTVGYQWHRAVQQSGRYDGSVDADLSALLDSIERHPWCNCYRRRKRTRQHEFKSWTKLIAFHIALIPLGKVWIQLLSLQLWVNSRTD